MDVGSAERLILIGRSAEFPTRTYAMEATMVRIYGTTLGDLISLFYEEFMEMYGDEELASVAAAAVINDLLAGDEQEATVEDAA